MAFNASVEARRAVDAGRGFGVVAVAVRDLADLVEASSKQMIRTTRQLDQRARSLASEIQWRDQRGAQVHDDEVYEALASVYRKVRRIQEPR